MFNKKKIRERPRGTAPNPMSQFGLLDMPDFNADDNFGMGDDDDIDDDDLEAELKLLEGGKIAKRPPRKPKQSLDLDSIQKMASTTIDDDEDDDDVDENDPDLLAELEGIVSDEDESEPVKPALNASSIISLLEERIQMYQSAISTAKSTGDTSKARRCGRGLDTLQNLLKSVKAGKVINEADIPPPIAISTKPLKPKEDTSLPPVNMMTDDILDVPSPNKTVTLPEPLLPLRPAPVLPSVPSIESSTKSLPVTPRDIEMSLNLDDEQSATKKLLITRRDQYKTAAVKAKQCGDQTTAIKYLKVVKQFESVISALESGHPIDLSQMPPPPPNITTPGDTSFAPSSPPKKLAGPKPEEVTMPEIEVSEEEAAHIMQAPPPPKTVMDALEQRLEKYKSAEESAKAEGNTTKARRMNRIVKQYQDAIKANKAGKTYDYSELPTPPGFAPIPGVGSKPSSSAPTGPAPNPSIPSATQSKLPVVSPAQKPQTQPNPAPKPHAKLAPQPSKRLTMSIHEQQLTVLLERHKQFKAAALEAKNNGDIQQAKEYLRMAKGFEPMIEASTNGLPVDMSKIPVPPQQQHDFVVVQHQDCSSETGDRGSTYKQLEKDLIEQVNMCTRNSEYFVRLGDVPSANKFNTYAKHSRKDLEGLRNAFKHGDPVPKFHYETRTFSLVQCCAELGDDDLEVVVVRGLNYSLAGYKPTDIDSYVKFEMAFPSEEPKSEKTHTVKSTNNPEYNSSFKLPIKRASRAFARFVKTKHIKFDVYAKGGWMRSDKLVGSTNVKLASLETICVLHDSFDLFDNRRPCGGKLEVKLRIREPFSAKQVEEVKEKWLIIDEFVRTSGNKIVPSLRTDSNDEPLCQDDNKDFSLVSGMAQIIQTAGIIPSPSFDVESEELKNEENLLL